MTQHGGHIFCQSGLDCEICCKTTSTSIYQSFSGLSIHPAHVVYTAHLLKFDTLFGVQLYNTTTVIY